MNDNEVSLNQKVTHKRMQYFKLPTSSWKGLSTLQKEWVSETKS